MHLEPLGSLLAPGTPEPWPGERQSAVACLSSPFCALLTRILDSTLTLCPPAKLALLTVLPCPGAEVQGLAHTSRFESLQAFGAG